MYTQPARVLFAGRLTSVGQPPVSVALLRFEGVRTHSEWGSGGIAVDDIKQAVQNFQDLHTAIWNFVYSPWRPEQRQSECLAQLLRLPNDALLPAKVPMPPMMSQLS